MFDRLWISVVQAIGAILIGYLAWIMTSTHFAILYQENPVFWMFHALDLGFHEFGHLFFGFFEQMHRTYFMHFLTVFGGSLMQWFVPFALVCYFIFTNRFYSAFFILFWLAQSFHDSVLYIESAIEMDIELLGGNNQAGHDWNYILHHLGVLYMDDQIARWILLASKALAWISVAGCVFMAIFGFVWEKEE